MTTLLAVLFLVHQEQVKPELYNGKTIYELVVGKPTGRNGYEEFVEAAMRVDKPLQKLASETPAFGTPHFLDSQKALAESAPQFETTVTKGLQKDVSYPVADCTYATLCPEFAKFKTIQRVLVAQATVRFSEGSPLSACKTLANTLDFATKLRGTGFLVEYYVACSLQNIATQCAAHALDQFPLEGAQAVEKAAERALKVDALKNSLLNEQDMGGRTLKGALEDPRGWILSMGITKDELDQEPEPNQRNQFREWCQFSPEKRKFLLDSALLANSNWFEKEVARYNLPEAKWSDYRVPDPDSDAAVALTAVPFIMMDSIWGDDDLFEIEIRRRTTLRLLILHCKIIAYRWKHGVLPTSLDDLDDKAATYDPLNTEPFHYQLNGSEYVLYSKGDKRWGQMFLEQSKATESDDGSGPGGPKEVAWSRSFWR